MLVSNLTTLTSPALFLRLVVQRVLGSSKLMQGFGLNTCQRLVNFFLHHTQPLELLQVWLVIILSIDPPTPIHPNLPVITIQLWWGVPSSRPPRSQAAQNRVAQMVWQANWTHHATPLYILLSDIFRGQVPPDYGVNDRVYLDTAAWRQAIIDNWQW